jgi:hypothetical protein
MLVRVFVNLEACLRKRYGIAGQPLTASIDHFAATLQEIVLKIRNITLLLF